MNMVNRCILAFTFMTLAFGGLTVAVPQTVSAAPAASCTSEFLGFPAWYRGLTESKTGNPCSIMSPDGQNGHPTLTQFVWLVVLNIVELALVAIAYLAAFYLLYGGFIFIMSRGRPEEAAKARSTMLDAIIGLIISMAAVAIVNFISDGIMK